MGKELTVFGVLRNALVPKEKTLSAVQQRGWWRIIGESFAGAWQQNVQVSQCDLTAYPTVYACIMRRATDGGKLPFCLKRVDENGIWTPVQVAAYSPVLRKPNRYQTAQQFREAWLISKLTQGNTYVLKVRDNRNVVVGMYVLDPCRVLPMITDSGAVYYQLQTDRLNGLPEGYPADKLLVPASEIIHDRCITLHHWLIGVPPLCAAYWPAVKNLKILKSSAEFFANNSNPGGILTAPAGMSDDDAQRVKDYWQTAYSGENSGKIAVIGADMKFTAFAMKGADSQLVEQMRYSDEQICQPFGIPPFKVGIGTIPAGLTVDAINLLYYDGALSSDIEAMENLLDDGIGLGSGDASNLGIWMDLDPLLRMDFGKQAEVEAALVGGKIKTPDEARRRFNLAPTGGGDTLWGQDQDKPLGVLSDPEYIASVMGTGNQSPAPAPPEDDTARTTAAVAHYARQSLRERLAAHAA